MWLFTLCLILSFCFILFARFQTKSRQNLGGWGVVRNAAHVSARIPFFPPIKIYTFLTRIHKQRRKECGGNVLVEVTVSHRDYP